MVTFRAGDGGTTLVRFLFYRTVLPNRFSERTNSEVAHEHGVVAGTVEAGLVGQDSIPFLVMRKHVVTTRCKRKLIMPLQEEPHRMNDMTTDSHLPSLSSSSTVGAAIQRKKKVW